MRASTSHGSMSRGISFAAAALAAASLMSAAASNIATANPAGHGSPAVEAEAHEARRCEWRSKQEHCYWIKVGSQSGSQR